MQLESLSIANYSYQGKLSVRATFSDGRNTINLELDQSLGADIVQVCSEAILKAVKDAADRLSMDALKMGNLIEHKKDEDDPPPLVDADAGLTGLEEGT